MTLGGVLVGAGAGVASAAPKTAAATVAVPYSCKIDGLPEKLTIDVAATAPTTAKAGSSITLTGVQSTTVIPVSLLSVIFAVAPTTTAIAGTVTTFDVNTVDGSPATLNAAATPFSFDVPVTKTQTTPADIVAPKPPISVGPFTAGTAGSMVISPGNVVISTKLGAVDCTAPAATAADSFTITVTGSGGSSTTPPSSTGEPWASPYYWMLIGMAGAAGVSLGGTSIVIRRRRRA
jgi:outer membrane murein-binding lipoprotein Lpp